MKFLTNTWAGFVEEILISLISSVLLLIGFYNVGALYVHSITDIFVLFILVFIIFESVVRIIRWTIVYHAPIYLYFLHLPAFIAIFIGVVTITKTRNLYSVAASSAIVIISVIYFAIMYIKRNVIRKKSPPGIRIQQLKWKMSIGERITLVFPDRYVKFLETGDEKYLEEGKDA